MNKFLDYYKYNEVKIFLVYKIIKTIKVQTETRTGELLNSISVYNKNLVVSIDHKL